MDRFVFDTDVLGELAEHHPQDLAALRDLVERGSVAVIVTHVQLRELSEWGNDKARDRLEGFPWTFVPTAGFILDVSRVDMARIMGDDDTASFERLRSRSQRHTHDALIGATAEYEDAVLVTNDERQAERIRRAGASVTRWSLARFRREVL